MINNKVNVLIVLIHPGQDDAAFKIMPTDEILIEVTFKK